MNLSVFFIASLLLAFALLAVISLAGHKGDYTKKIVLNKLGLSVLGSLFLSFIATGVMHSSQLLYGATRFSPAEDAAHERVRKEMCKPGVGSFTHKGIMMNCNDEAYFALLESKQTEIRRQHCISGLESFTYLGERYTCEGK